MKEKIILNLDEEINVGMKKKKKSYMDLFLEKRQQAVDFALKGNNKSRYKYIKPPNYINVQEEPLIDKKINFLNDKKKIRYDKSYTNLRNNLLGETKNSFITENINYIKNNKHLKINKNNDINE